MLDGLPDCGSRSHARWHRAGPDARVSLGHTGNPRLHDVRHSYASAALADGIPAKVISERPGHANISITLATYSPVLPGLNAEAANAAARFNHDEPVDDSGDSDEGRRHVDDTKPEKRLQGTHPGE
jgi:integrase